MPVIPTQFCDVTLKGTDGQVDFSRVILYARCSKFRDYFPQDPIIEFEVSCETLRAFVSTAPGKKVYPIFSADF